MKSEKTKANWHISHIMLGDETSDILKLQEPMDCIFKRKVKDEKKASANCPTLPNNIP
jgi:hypothetical protein